MSKPNPRRSNGTLRNKLRKRMAAHQGPCALCGRPIDYTLPAGDDWSFELDEIVPVSRYQEGGYATPEQCALDPANHQPAHRICNRAKSNKMMKDEGKESLQASICTSPIDWFGLFAAK